mmetsp:Transcript_28298/g.74669  ORF Transcript_28298/g.74669 Transcript_28298/m.74669 type:complete len:260 (+) Transcript_28298:285-1064(+)
MPSLAPRAKAVSRTPHNRSRPSCLPVWKAVAIRSPTRERTSLPQDAQVGDGELEIHAWLGVPHVGAQGVRVWLVDHHLLQVNVRHVAAHARRRSERAAVDIDPLQVGVVVHGHMSTDLIGCLAPRGFVAIVGAAREVGAHAVDVLHEVHLARVRDTRVVGVARWVHPKRKPLSAMRAVSGAITRGVQVDLDVRILGEVDGGLCGAEDATSRRGSVGAQRDSVRPMQRDDIIALNSGSIARTMAPATDPIDNEVRGPRRG